MIHPSSDVKTKNIGIETDIWQFCVVLEGATIGTNCNINAHCLIENDVVIGNNTTIKSGVYLWDGIRIQDDVFVGPNVTFTNDNRPRSKKYQKNVSPTVLKKGCSIGAGAILKPGITIGEYSMVGMGAIVTKDVPANTLWLGQPAEFKKFICDCGTYLDTDSLECTSCSKKYFLENNELLPDPKS